VSVLLAIPMPDALRAWHVVYTKPRQEFRALENLQNQGFEAFLPTLEVERRQRSKVQTVVEALFSRYVFVRFNEHADPWHRIRNTLGVSGLLKIGTEPARISDAIVQALKNQCIAPVELYQSGDAVHIVSGPLQGLVGIFEQKDGQQRAMILIDMLNKTQRIGLPLDVIAPSP